MILEDLRYDAARRPGGPALQCSMDPPVAPLGALYRRAHILADVDRKVVAVVSVRVVQSTSGGVALRESAFGVLGSVVIRRLSLCSKRRLYRQTSDLSIAKL
jgi:hypothetical protein